MYEPFAYVEGIFGLTSPGGSLVNLGHSYGEIVKKDPRNLTENEAVEKLALMVTLCNLGHCLKQARRTVPGTLAK